MPSGKWPLCTSIKWGLHTEGGTRGKCHGGSHPGSVSVGDEMQLDSSQDRDLVCKTWLGEMFMAGRTLWQPVQVGAPGSTQHR